MPYGYDPDHFAPPTGLMQVSVLRTGLQHVADNYTTRDTCKGRHNVDRFGRPSASQADRYEGTNEKSNYCTLLRDFLLT